MTGVLLHTWWTMRKNSLIQLGLGNAMASHMTPAFINSLVAWKASSFHILICPSAKETCPGLSGTKSLSPAHSLALLMKNSRVQFISFGIKVCSSDHRSYRAFALSQFTRYTIGLSGFNSSRVIKVIGSDFVPC